MISIHAPREGGDSHISVWPGSLCISIHAPREGGDLRDLADDMYLVNISIHAPREGGDLIKYALL